ncbi:MAG: class I SAM-dependent methyltransferase [Chloroflexi bacterium]|nr:class I SAM-dependent methyltransferase [Chloroflexota bacterium]
MNIQDIVDRTPVPLPWSEGEKIPWNDPDFSQRMLAEHLSQRHDAASRRNDLLDAQVQWIHQQVLGGQPTRILDLGCGPGLYTSRLARLGHTCAGIDFSPASIAYARESASREGLHCTYELADIRHAEYGSGFGLVMLLFGEFNVFRREDARQIVRKAYAALHTGGRLLLEPHTLEAVAKIGAEPSHWFTQQNGLFSAQSHLLLTEAHWDEVRRIAIERYYVVDAGTGAVTRHAASMQGYTPEAYAQLLVECGFDSVEFHPSISGATDERQQALCGISARRGVISEQ